MMERKSSIKVQLKMQWRCYNANLHSIAKAFNAASEFRVFASYFQSHQKLELAADSGTNDKCASYT